MGQIPVAKKNRFIRTHPAWVLWIRHPAVIWGTLLVLALFGFFFLPNEDTPKWLANVSLSFFTFLTLFWSGVVLSDRSKSDRVKAIVAFSLMALLAWLFYQYSGANWSRLQSSFFDWDRMDGNWGELFKGLFVTLEIALISGILSVLIGLLVSILRFIGSPTLTIFLSIYIDIFRSIPMVVLMVVLFFALPYLGISLGSITTTVVALSLGYGAYASECFRSGFEAVSPGQIEAARSLGLSRWQTIRLVVLPQAIPVVIPPLTGNLVSMLKDTAVASLVASPELLKRARELYTSKASPTPLIAAAILYLLVLIPLVRISNMLENKVKKSL